MKNIKSLSIFIITFFLILLGSCKSVSNIIPGKTNTIIKNIYFEYYNIAEIYYSLEKYDKAILYYEKSLECEDLYWSSYYKLAKCYVFTSQYSNALSMFKEMYEKDVDNQNIKSSLAYVYAMTFDFDNAIILYEELYKQEQSNIDYIENLISIYLLSEDYQSAQKYYLELKEKYPDSSKISAFEKELQVHLDQEGSPEIDSNKPVNENENSDIVSKID